MSTQGGLTSPSIRILVTRGLQFSLSLIRTPAGTCQSHSTLLPAVPGNRSPVKTFLGFLIFPFNSELYIIPFCLFSPFVYFIHLISSSSLSLSPLMLTEQRACDLILSQLSQRRSYGWEMSELSKDPAIKLFGRTIPLHEVQPNPTEPEKVTAFYLIVCIFW